MREPKTAPGPTWKLKSVSGSRARAERTRVDVSPSTAHIAPNQFRPFSFINFFSCAFICAEWRCCVRARFRIRGTGESCGSELSVGDIGTKGRALQRPGLRRSDTLRNLNKVLVRVADVNRPNFAR